eukprot:1380461-Pyramimonas_sp.AAC.1
MASHFSGGITSRGQRLAEVIVHLAIRPVRKMCLQTMALRKRVSMVALRVGEKRRDVPKRSASMATVSTLCCNI